MHKISEGSANNMILNEGKRRRQRASSRYDGRNLSEETAAFKAEPGGRAKRKHREKALAFQKDGKKKTDRAKRKQLNPGHKAYRSKMGSRRVEEGRG